MPRIYLDNAATTPLHPDAATAMREAMEVEAGNPSSLHEQGRRARLAIDVARETLSRVLGCEFAEVLFTSSGTESANLAIVGAALANIDPRRKRVLFGASEHHCVLGTSKLLSRLGYEVQTVPCDRYGRIEVDELPSEARDVLLVSAMHANNELGAINPIVDVATWARSNGALFHCDAVQTFGWLDWKVSDLRADMVSVSAHKLHGPQGIGALYIKAGTRIHPLILGGGQERDMRAGTENLLGIVGFGAAIKAVVAESNRLHRKQAARDAFLGTLQGAVRSVPPEVDCMPGHAHVRFPGVSAESLLILLDRKGVSASSGAACSSGSIEPSHVLRAAGYSEVEAKEGIRFTFGKDSTEDIASDAAIIVNHAVAQLQRG